MKIVCRNCLLADMDKQEVYESVKELVASIPDEKRADEEAYSSRLSVCRECDNLSDGMCVKCGCFVEARAARKNAICPDERDRWH